MQKLKVVDTSGLSDADWAAINRVNRAFALGGIDGFWDELENLGDLVLQIRVAFAFFPDVIHEAISDEMAEHGLAIEDLHELLRRAESPARDQ
jgi:hypothetical protein